VKLLTDGQTNKCPVKHNLLGGSKNELSFKSISFLLSYRSLFIEINNVVSTVVVIDIFEYVLKEDLESKYVKVKAQT